MKIVINQKYNFYPGLKISKITFFLSNEIRVSENLQSHRTLADSHYQATPWDNLIHTLQSVPLFPMGFTFYNSEVKWNAAVRRHKSLQDDNNVF